MKEETKEEIRANTEAFLTWLVDHPVIRGFLVGLLTGLFLAWVF